MRHNDAYASVLVVSPSGYSSTKSAPTLTTPSEAGEGRLPLPASAPGWVQTSVKISIRGAPSTPACSIPARRAGS